MAALLGRWFHSPPSKWGGPEQTCNPGSFILFLRSPCKYPLKTHQFGWPRGWELCRSRFVRAVVSKFGRWLLCFQLWRRAYLRCDIRRGGWFAFFGFFVSRKNAQCLKALFVDIYIQWELGIGGAPFIGFQFSRLVAAEFLLDGLLMACNRYCICGFGIIRNSMRVQNFESLPTSDLFT